mgnify:CR=1 FL=1
MHRIPKEILNYLQVQKFALVFKDYLQPLVHRELVMARLLFGEIGLRSICKAHLPMSSKRKQKSSKFSSKNPEFGLTPQQ